MSKLNYLGVVFDFWNESEFGKWSCICSKCIERHHLADRPEIDPEPVATETCGVCGCNNSGVEHNNYYIDFFPEHITTIAE